MIFFIALLHTLPIFFYTWKYNSKTGLWVVAGVCAAIGVATGNSAYTYADLLAVGVVLWNCIKVLKRRQQSQLLVPVVSVRAPPGPNQASQWVGAIVLLGILVFVLFQGLSQPIAAVAPPAPATPSSIPSPEAIAVPPARVIPLQVQNARPVTPEPRKPIRRTAGPVERCLAIIAEAQMVKCLEGVK